MAGKAYLTIDDSPSIRMDDLTDYLYRHEIPALFFCRGDLIEKNPIAVIRAIQQGFLIGNHTYSHIRASQASFEEIVEEIEKTETLIDKMYDVAHVEKPGLYFRFPHLDRGCGSQILDFEAMDVKERTYVKSIFTEGLNVISNKRPTAEAIEKKERLQEYLKSHGYTAPFPDANLPWYKNNKEIQEAADCLFTYSSADWMLTQRHIGKWRYKSIEDLRAKIDNDQWVLKDGGVNIVLVHDQAEITDSVLLILDHMRKRDIEFLEMK